MRILFLAFLLAFAAPLPAARAQAEPEVAFIGQLRSITLTPRDWQAERRALDGGEAVVVSNSCGTASTTFRVVRATAALPRQVRTTSSIGEWCDLPIGLTRDLSLVVMTRRDRELLASYDIIEQQGAAYALFLDAQELLDRRPAELRQLLALQPLPEPIEYEIQDVEPSALAELVSRRPALEIRDGKVWIVRAIPLARVFPGFSTE